MAKKNVEKPIVTVTTATEVADKPKRTRRTTRSTEVVISEITEGHSTVGETTKAVAKILDSKKEKKDGKSITASFFPFNSGLWQYPHWKLHLGVKTIHAIFCGKSKRDVF